MLLNPKSIIPLEDQKRWNELVEKLNPLLLLFASNEKLSQEQQISYANLALDFDILQEKIERLIKEARENPKYTTDENHSSTTSRA